MSQETARGRAEGNLPINETGLLVLAFVLLSAFYILTAPANHSISYDSYWYARIITQNSISEVEHPRLFLWLASMQFLYGAASLFTTEPDVYRVVGAANALQTALTVVLLVRLLVRFFGVDRTAAWLSAGLFAFTYGIWRYATEIEVYATASLFCVLLLLGAFGFQERAPGHRGPWLVGLGVLGGVATLFYQPEGLLAGVALPVFLLFATGFRAAFIYCAVSGIVVAGGTILAAEFAAASITEDNVDFILDTKALSLRIPDLVTPIKLLFGLGSEILSTNWMLAFEPVRTIFAKVAPNRDYAAEIFVARHAGAIVWVALLTLPLAAYLFLVRLVPVAFRSGSPQRFDLREVTLWLWLILHTGMIVLLAPGTLEPWIPALVAITALAARRLIAPAVTAGSATAAGLLVAIFLVHNAAVGIGVLATERGDYTPIRGRLVMDLAAPEDLVITGMDRPFSEYLRFSGMRHVLDAKEDGMAAVRTAIAEATEAHRTIWLLDDAVTPPRYLQVADPETAAAIGDLASGLTAGAKVHSLIDGSSIYEIDPSGFRP